MPLPSVIDELDRLFDELIHRPWGERRALVPAAIREVADGWMVELTVEGLRAADLKVEVHGRRLVVSGHRRREQRGDPKTGRFRTQQEVALQQSITLPVEARPEDVEANVEGSVLTIHIRRPKR